MLFSRALTLSILGFLAYSGLVFLFAHLLNFDLTSGQNPPNDLWYYAMVFSVIITFFVTLFYFKAQGTKESFREGFQLGLFFLITSAILEAIFALIIVNQGLIDQQNIVAYYQDYRFWIAAAFIPLTASLCAAGLKR